MKKWLFSLLLISGTVLGQVKTFSVDEWEYLNPDLIETGHLYVKGMRVAKFDKPGKAKIFEAFKLLEEVVNSEEFKNKIINFKNAKGERAFSSNRGLSNEAIYQRFMEGRETLQYHTPGEMNFYLEQYDDPTSNVIGYTTPKKSLIYINRKYFDKNAVYAVAGNLSHEWTHKLGFDHTSAAEHDSVPYAIGYIVLDLCKKLTLRPQTISQSH